MKTHCKNCERTEQLVGLDVEALINEQLALEVDLVPNELKEARLTICGTCPKLARETCLLCGCYVGFRASLAYKTCPLKKW